jgi:hypothetical protein
MGTVEFNELRNRHALGKEDLYQYITSLEEQCILRPQHAQNMKKNVGKIFGEENRKEEIHKIDEMTRGAIR